MARTKEGIAEAIELIFKNTERIHGKSEALDWIKIASLKSAGYLESYHKEKLREELIAYDKYISTHYWDGEIPSIEKAVDMYLKSR